MRGSRRFVYVIVLLLLTLSAAAADEGAGSIEELRGAAQVHRGATQIAALVGMVVMVADRIETLADSELTLILRGGTRLRLGEASTMIIDEDLVTNGTSIRSTVRLLLGKLR